MADLPRISFVPQGNRDQIFQTAGFPKKFVFNADVANVFDDMVLRSIPMYEEVLQTVMMWTAYFYQDGSKVYDLGCSTGSTLLALAENLQQRLNLVGIDNAAPMLEKARAKLTSHQQKHQVQLIHAQIEDIVIEDASVVIMNYTLQFLPVRVRQQILEKIYRGLRPGGILFLSEKLRSTSPIFQDTLTRTYEQFKINNGYTRTEIEAKKEALDNVLIPHAPEEHQHNLRAAGFDHVEMILRWHNFASFVAIKQ